MPSFLPIFIVLVGALTLGENARGGLQQQLFEAVGKSSPWKSRLFPGKWMTVSSDPVISRIEEPQMIFGLKPRRIFVYGDLAGRVSTVYIVYRESGYDLNPWRQAEPWQRKRAEADFAKVAAQLPKNLASATRQAGVPAVIGADTPTFRFKVTEYTFAGLTFQTYVEDQRAICLLVSKAGASPHELFASLPAAQRAADLAARVERRADGDVLVRHVPMIDQDGRPYCGPAVWTEIARYYGLNVFQEMMLSGGREGGASMQEAADLSIVFHQPFDLARIQASIDSGNPVWFSCPGHVALITGYNARKKEIFRTDSWGEGARNRRMKITDFTREANGYLFITPRQAGPRRSELVGNRTAGREFIDSPGNAAYLVGFHAAIGDWFGTPIVASLQPIYEEGGRRFAGGIFGAPDKDQSALLEAPPGYVISQLVVSAPENHVHGLKAIFRRLDPKTGRLSSRDFRESAWIGIRRGESTVTVGSYVRPATGILGRQLDWIGALGLQTAD